MQVQLEQYLQRSGFVVNPQTLVIVDGTAFGNNVRRVLELLQPTLRRQQPCRRPQLQQAALISAKSLNRLYAAGARNILLANATNMGCTPPSPHLDRRRSRWAPGCRPTTTAVSLPRCCRVRAVSPGMNIYLVDFGAMSNEMKANPPALALPMRQRLAIRSSRRRPPRFAGLRGLTCSGTNSIRRRRFTRSEPNALLRRSVAEAPQATKKTAPEGAVFFAAVRNAVDRVDHRAAVVACIWR